jgi:hypothetical protein
MSEVALQSTRKLPYPRAANGLKVYFFTNEQKALFLYILDFTSTLEKDFSSSSRALALALALQRAARHAQHG